MRKIVLRIKPRIEF